MFEAWVHGPVSAKLYKKYRGMGWNLIHLDKNAKIPKFPEEVEELLESVWTTYGDRSGNDLEATSHNETPWREARRGLGDDDPGNRAVNPKEMRIFYRSIYEGDM